MIDHFDDPIHHSIIIKKLLHLLKTRKNVSNKKKCFFFEKKCSFLKKGFFLRSWIEK